MCTNPLCFPVGPPGIAPNTSVFKDFLVAPPILDTFSTPPGRADYVERSRSLRFLHGSGRPHGKSHRFLYILTRSNTVRERLAAAPANSRNALTGAACHHIGPPRRASKPKPSRAKRDLCGSATPICRCLGQLGALWAPGVPSQSCGEAFM